MKLSQQVSLFILAIVCLSDAIPLRKHHKISKRSDAVVQFLLGDIDPLLNLNKQEDEKFNKLELTGFTNYEHDCAAVITSPDAPTFMRSSCPWFYERNHDARRYPKSFMTAKLKCSQTTCLGDPQNECVPINQELNILITTGHMDLLNNTIYETQQVQVPVGFTCAGRRIVSNDADTVNHTTHDDPFDK